MSIRRSRRGQVTRKVNPVLVCSIKYAQERRRPRPSKSEIRGIPRAVVTIVRQAIERKRSLALRMTVFRRCPQNLVAMQHPSAGSNNAAAANGKILTTRSVTPGIGTFGCLNTSTNLGVSIKLRRAARRLHGMPIVNNPSFRP
jgi:hypothetical protein